MIMSGGHPSNPECGKTKTSRLNTHADSNVDTGELMRLTYADEDVFKHEFKQNKENNVNIQFRFGDMESTEKPEASESVQSISLESCTKLRALTRPCFIVVLLLGIWIYIGFSLYSNPGQSVFACIIAPFVTWFLINLLTRGKLAKQSRKVQKVVAKALTPKPGISIWIRRLSTIGVVIAIAVFLIIDIWDKWHKWIPLGGLAGLVLLSVLGSKNPTKINWTVVIWGIILQFSMGLIILRWTYGFEACKWLGKQVTTLLSYTDVGSEFVFGEKYINHPVVFKVLPTVIFFSSMVSTLYYLGAMQSVIKSIATVLQFFLNATPIESFATAAHIFIGQVESSVALKPFWHKLTDSEIHSIMTSGFATVAGTIIAAYVEFGIPAEHVISASFMSAPAALAIAKISFPETEVSQIKTQKAINLPSGQESNLIEALSVGATVAVKLISFVVVNIIAFIAVFAFLDATLSYFGGLVNCPQLSFQLICSYVFMPLAAAIGIPWSETGTVGILIGKKIFLNELLAYVDLGAMLKTGEVSERTGVLSTYILCGFGSIAALGVNLGSLTSAAPEMRPRFAKLLFRSLVNGNVACFMTACVAGLLFQESNLSLELSSVFNSTATLGNATTISNIVTST